MITIPELQYVPDFISPLEEAELLQQIYMQPWNGALKRRTQHYGYYYNYRRRHIDADAGLGPLPSWAQGLAQRLHREGLMPDIPDQMLVNEYAPGVGIAPHVDCEPCFGDTICSLSLSSDAVMDFSNLHTGDHVPLLLERRSLLLLHGIARYQWTHGIAARKTDSIGSFSFRRGLRVSLTFRKVIEAVAAPAV